MSTVVSLGILVSGIVFGVSLMLDMMEQARLNHEEMEERRPR